MSDDELFRVLLFLICVARAMDAGQVRAAWQQLRDRKLEDGWLNGQMMVGNLYVKVLARYAEIWLPQWVLVDGELEYA